SRSNFFRCPDLHKFSTRHPQNFHISGDLGCHWRGFTMLAPVTAEHFMRIRRGSALAVVVLGMLSAAARASASDAMFLRLFLKDGTPVVSYGEFARVNDHVVFSMPVGGSAETPRLHLISLPDTTIDWARTDRYGQSARYQQYAGATGEEDFARLSNDVAQVL